MRLWLVVLLLAVSTVWASESWIGVHSAVRGEPSVISVHSVAAQAWQIEIAVSGFERSLVQRDGRSFDVLDLPSEAITNVDGVCDLPAISRLIGLRSDADPSLEIVSEEWTDIDGVYHLAPPEDAAGSAELSTRDIYLPENTYTLSPRQNMGGVPLADLYIVAARYNPVQHRVRVLRSLTVRVRENGARVTYDRGITETIAQVLRGALPNWAELGLDELVVRGTFLYIVADTTTAPAQIRGLVTWRTHKGYRVEVASPAQIGSPLSATNVKNYIQARYNNANPPLEFVCLVGDGNGSYVVPYYTYHEPEDFTVTGSGDFGFTQLTGTDLLPDISIGRLWFDSAPTLLTQVNKTLRYEQTPAQRNLGTRTNWYKAGGVVGDYDNQSISVSHIQTMRWARERMLDVGYISSSIDTLYYTNYAGQQAIQPSIVLASLNAGSSVWCYRGWNRMNEFPVSLISSLNNVGDWPFMLNMTCNTNDFNQSSAPCLGEAFMVPTASTLNPAGTIGFVGFASGGTHTRYNNIMIAGAVQGLLREGVRTTGGTVVSAKLEMFRNFPLSADQVEVAFFAGILSLLGDPAVDVFTDTPDTLSIDNPTTLPTGSNSLTLQVTKQGGGAADSAYVNLVKGTEVFIGGYTDATGNITLNFQCMTPDTLFITASKHNSIPAIRYALVTASTQYVSPSTSTFVIDDDNNGSSHGNSDAHANPGETIELSIPLRNWGSSSVSGVSATLSTADPFILSIPDNTESYGTIAPGAVVVSSDDFDFTVAPYAPDGQVVQFTLTVMDGAFHTWTSQIPITLCNARLDYTAATLVGVGNGVLDPSESGQVYVSLSNGGNLSLAAGRTGYLRSGTTDVTITDSVGTFAAFPVGGSGSNQSDPFGISATGRALPGERIPLTCIFPLSSGYADTVRFSLTVGTVTSNSPTPADAYGYWAFDNTDTAYAKHPTYDWVEIDPDSGGLGTQLPLTDEWDGNDASMAVDLPFTFQYYGQDYDQITVCTNGWMGMGGDQAMLTDFRNYGIPSSIGASAMIAPFWDDLRTSQPMGFLSGGHGDPDGDALDDGGEGCTSAAVISTLPFTDTGNTCQHTSSSCNGYGNNSQDVFYRYTVPAGGQTLDIQLCGSSYHTRLLVWTGSCCSASGPFAVDSTSCSDGHARLLAVLPAGNVWIMIEGYGWGPSTCGSYSLNVSTFNVIPPGHVCTYNDAVNHRFIVEWSRMFKYNAVDNPPETFECILYQPGYPSTPTGDGEILFQYRNISNTTDVDASIDYCTAGIENLNQTDGVLYSYNNQCNPTIPGAAPLVSGRAVLFTTAENPPERPCAPTGVTVYGIAGSASLRWNAVTQDVLGNPLPSVQYNIYRGAQYDFVPDASNLLTTVSGISYLDSSATGSRYFYNVQAVSNGQVSRDQRQGVDDPGRR